MIDIEKTPFKLVGNDKDGYSLTLGNYVLVRDLKNMDDAIEHLAENMWEIILQMNIAVIDLNGRNKIELPKTQTTSL